MKTRSVFVLLAAAVLVSCSKDEKVVDNSIPEITLKSSVLTMDAATRAPFEGALSQSNPFTAIVLATETQGGYNTLRANGTMTFKGGDDGVAYNQPLESGTSTFRNDDPVFLSGLYPAIYGTGGWNITNGTATFTITGKDDLMKAPEVSTTKQDVRDLNFATLEFSHELTKMDLRFRADGPEAISAFGTIKKVELTRVNSNSIPTQAAITLNTGAIVFSGSATSLPCYSMSMDADGKATYTNTVYPGGHLLTTDNTYLAYTMAPPATAAVTPGSNEYEYTVTYNNGTGADQTKTATIDLKDKDGNFFTGSTKGYAFLISFNFSKNEINASATVQDWNEGGESVVVIE